MKMGDRFALPLKVRPLGTAADDANGDLAIMGPGTSMASLFKTNAAAHAINCHDDLVNALSNLRRRFHAALISTGTDPEFADIAVAEADAILNKAKGK